MFEKKGRNDNIEEKTWVLKLKLIGKACKLRPKLY